MMCSQQPNDWCLPYCKINDLENVKSFFLEQQPNEETRYEASCSLRKWWLITLIGWPLIDGAEEAGTLDEWRHHHLFSGCNTQEDESILTAAAIIQSWDVIHRGLLLSHWLWASQAIHVHFGEVKKNSLAKELISHYSQQGYIHDRFQVCRYCYIVLQKVL